MENSQANQENKKGEKKKFIVVDVDFSNENYIPEAISFDSFEKAVWLATEFALAANITADSMVTEEEIKESLYKKRRFMSECGKFLTVIAEGWED